MGEYKYIAIDPTGNDIKGKIEAINDSVAKKILEDRNLIVMKIGENISILDNIKQSINYREDISFKYTKYLSTINKRLSFLLKNGINITTALKSLSREFASEKKLSKAFLEIKKEVESGKTLAKSFEKYSNIFPKLMIDMIEAGELSGNLSDVLLQLSVVYSKNKKLKDQIKKSLIMPSLTLIISFLLILMMFKFVLPKMAGLYASFDSELPKLTMTLMKITNFINSNFELILIGILLFIFASINLLKVYKVKRFVDYIFLKIPFFGNILIKYNLSLFCRILSMLLKSGIEIQKSLTICNKIIHNNVLREELEKLKEGVLVGNSISSIADTSKIYPELFKRILDAGEQTGSMDEVLKELAEEYQYDIDMSSEKITIIMNIGITLLLGGIVAFIAVAMYVPIVSMSQSFM